MTERIDPKGKRFIAPDDYNAARISPEHIDPPGSKFDEDLVPGRYSSTHDQQVEFNPEGDTNPDPSSSRR